MDNGEPFFIGQSKEHAWNPLTDDGDALRLAVKLRMHISAAAVGGVFIEVSRKSTYEIFEPVNNDPCAATRRAITRAAAEIGRRM